MSKILSKRA